MLEIALVILTINNAGLVRMSLSPAETMEACVEQAETVNGMLTGFGYTVLGMRCGKSDMALSEFSHGATVEDERHRYRVALLGDGLEGGFELTAVADGETCHAPTSEQAYCVVSSQSVLAKPSDG